MACLYANESDGSIEIPTAIGLDLLKMAGGPGRVLWTVCIISTSCSSSSSMSRLALRGVTATISDTRSSSCMPAFNAQLQMALKVVGFSFLEKQICIADQEENLAMLGVLTRQLYRAMASAISKEIIWQISCKRSKPSHTYRLQKSWLLYWAGLMHTNGARQDWLAMNVSKTASMLRHLLPKRMQELKFKAYFDLPGVQTTMDTTRCTSSRHSSWLIPPLWFNQGARSCFPLCGSKSGSSPPVSLASAGIWPLLSTGPTGKGKGFDLMFEINRALHASSFTGTVCHLKVLVLASSRGALRMEA